MVCVVVLCKMSLPPLSSVLFKSVLSSEIHQFWLSSCRRTLCLSVIPKPRVEISRCCKSTCRNKWLPDKCSWTQTFCVMAPGLYSTFALHKSIKMDQCESCRTYTPILNSSIRNKSSVRKTKIKKQTNILKERFEEIIMRENIITIPNVLCATRIILSPILGYLVLQKSFDFALGVFVFAGATDLLDGFIARNFRSQQSMLGSFLDPLADKLLIFSLVMSLTISDLIPVALTSLIIARDVLLVTAGFYIRYLSLPPPKTFSRFFDVTHATAQLTPTFISKLNTGVQLLLVAYTLAVPVLHFDFIDLNWFLEFLWYFTGASTVASGLSYVFSKNTYHLLKNAKEKGS